MTGTTIGAQSCFYNPVSKIATIVASVTMSPGVGANVIFCTVPDKYTPKFNMYGIVGNANNTPMGKIGVAIGTSGGIIQGLSGSCTAIEFMITYSC